MTKYTLMRWCRYARYDIPRGISNIIDYAPLVWRTREWDYSYLYEMIIFKLKRMEICLDDTYLHSEKDAKDIKVARICLERLVDDDLNCECGKVRCTGACYERIDAQRKQDMELFCKMFKKSGAWWN